MILGLRAQVITSPDLACAATLVNGDVLLTWNLPSNSCGPFVAYDIYASNTGIGGPYSLLASVPTQATTTYLHSGANGTSVTWYYYMMSNHNCPGYTQLSSDTLDNLDPVAPPIINATVVNNWAQLNWMPFVSPETYAYIIYRDIGGFNPIDTVYGRNSTQYTDFTSQVPIHPEEYIIAAMDSCGNTGTTTTQSHRTIHLTCAIGKCVGYVDMQWTDYIGFTVAGYDVMYSVNGGPYQVAGSFGDTVTSFQLTGFNDDDTLCTYIRAHDGAGTSAHSNTVCFVVNFTQSLQELFITGLTVLPNQTVQISWQATKADLTQIVVQRSNDGVNFSNIKTYAPPFPNPIVMSFVDTMVNPSERSWHYAIAASDSCGDTLRTEPAQTIHLTGRARPNFTNTLEWNDPDIEFATVISFVIHLDDNGVWTFRGSSFTPDGFQDDITGYLSDDGIFCYYVNATGVMALPTGSALFASASNIRCIEQFAIIQAPTAFVPGGLNNFFKPVITYGQEGTYSMSIYNRYGQLLFTTTDPDQAWDGRHNGLMVPQGVYAYMIQVQGPNKNVETKTGTVMVIR
jgi:gliding motility-associated-like protein